MSGAASIGRASGGAAAPCREERRCSAAPRRHRVATAAAAAAVPRHSSTMPSSSSPCCCCPSAPCAHRRHRYSKPSPLVAHAGADAGAFEGLLGAGAGSPLKRHAPSAFTAMAADPASLQQQRGGLYGEAWSDQQQQQSAAGAASPTGSFDDGDAAVGALLPPIVPLHGGAKRFAWAAPDGTPLEVLHRPGAPQGDARDGGSAAGSEGGGGGDGGLQRPPIVFIHGLFRGAWAFDEALMPALASAGYDCYALSLRGQGSSGVGAPGGAAGVIERRGGVPLGVNVADIAAFVGSLAAPVPPVLVGHSLGGTFVQEYLARLAEQQQQQQQAAEGSTTSSSSAAAAAAAGDEGASASGPPLPRLPPLSGAAALASACAGTVMAFGDFVADVGLAEFVCQMGVVFTGAHLRSVAVARYCWWPRTWPRERLERLHEAVKASSRVPPYVASEIAAWAPDPYGSEAAAAAAAASAEGAEAEAAAAAAATAAAGAPAPPPADVRLPPVLAIGGADDRVIRPFQIEAFAPRWRARARVLPGVTHDLMFGPQALRVAVELLAWLESPPVAAAAVEAAAAAAAAAEAEAAAAGPAQAQQRPAAAVAVLPLHQGLDEPGIGSRPVLGGAAGSAGGAAGGGGVAEARQPLAPMLSV